MEHADLAPRYLSGAGVEIGAFKTPIPGIKPVYVDRFAVYANEPTHADYHGDACELPFHDSSLKYVASSHVLEHVANPLAALAEWFRVLEHGGCIYMVVPDRRRTFDHRRPLTEVAHMLDDYRNGTTQSDATHIDDFVYGVDWATFSPATDPANEKSARDELATTYHRSVAAGLEINIHFHTFEVSSGVALIEAGNLESLWDGAIEVVEKVEEFPSSNPNGFLVVARVHKRIGARWKALWSSKGLRADARRF
ncbi:MAG TPA: methyltransferase domain-containing protein [Opitutaceae bacterium]|nr:methyltransferase domain-containing protein [Opitutaceae bacterium]